MDGKPLEHPQSGSIVPGARCCNLPHARRSHHRREAGRAMARTPIHPGEILGGELDELGMSAAELARLIDVPPSRISQIVAGRRNMTADTALRLAHWFGTTPDLWMNLQKTWELDLARAELAEALERLPRRAAVPSP
ncbi:HigA family addiction module antitoxin [Geminicoccaceae bacterium 1502E]|nr:HigA family addiction module antitoxin [Geminicoccaceae bacterium 1502E]